MGLKSIGTQKGDSPKTPTLRQYLKANETAPVKNYVKLVFKPNDYGQIGLITSTNFRVTVTEESGLYSPLIEILENLVDNQICLVITVTDHKKCIWELSEEDSSCTEWESHHWGWMSKKIIPRSKRTPKKPAQ